MKVTIIKGNGYTKHLFSELGLSGNEEFSLFFWKNGESPAHDHSVDEITYIAQLDGEFSEIRKVGDEFITRTYQQGDSLEVPAGTEHIVRVKGRAVTINWCNGKLEMNILKDFLRDPQLA